MKNTVHKMLRIKFADVLWVFKPKVMWIRKILRRNILHFCDFIIWWNIIAYIMIFLIFTMVGELTLYMQVALQVSAYIPVFQGCIDNWSVKQKL